MEGSSMDVWIDLNDVAQLLPDGNGIMINCRQLFLFSDFEDRKIFLKRGSKICITRNRNPISSIRRFELLRSSGEIQRIHAGMGEGGCFSVGSEHVINENDRIRIFTNENIMDCSIKIETNPL